MLRLVSLHMRSHSALQHTFHLDIPTARTLLYIHTFVYLFVYPYFLFPCTTLAVPSLGNQTTVQLNDHQPPFNTRMTPAGKIPSTALSTGTRAFATSTTVSSRRPSLLGLGLSARLENAASWLHRTTQATSGSTAQPALQGQQHSLKRHHGVPSKHRLAAASFSTSGPTQRSSSSSKEEEDLYQV